MGLCPCKPASEPLPKADSWSQKAPSDSSPWKSYFPSPSLLAAEMQNPLFSLLLFLLALGITASLKAHVKVRAPFVQEPGPGGTALIHWTAGITKPSNLLSWKSSLLYHADHNNPPSVKMTDAKGKAVMKMFSVWRKLRRFQVEEREFWDKARPRSEIVLMDFFFFF